MRKFYAKNAKQKIFKLPYIYGFIKEYLCSVFKLVGERKREKGECCMLSKYFRNLYAFFDIICVSNVIVRVLQLLHALLIFKALYEFDIDTFQIRMYVMSV